MPDTISDTVMHSMTWLVSSCTAWPDWYRHAQHDLPTGTVMHSMTYWHFRRISHHRKNRCNTSVRCNPSKRELWTNPRLGGITGLTRKVARQIW